MTARISTRRGAVGLMILGLAACADSTVTTPTPTPQPFTQSLTGMVTAHADLFYDLTVPRNGNATLTLKWANGAVDLDLSLTAAACADSLPVDCELFAITDASIGVSEHISRPVKAGERFRLWVVSLADVDQPYALQIDIR